ncbi:MAG: hypothetical protein GKR89_02365 [Candidatus Latescibacteria bacterium]|nr:hypothetical protein [Candidatus Latescibacterota bacterium]
MPKWLYLGIFGLLCGCTGTDFIADPPVAVEPRILISPDMVALEVGTSQMLAATYFDETGMLVDEATIRWSISNEEIATVDETGTVRALSQGQVTIAASVDQVVSDSVLVNIVDDSDQVAAVRLAPTRAQLQPGETLQLAAESTNARGDLLTGRVYTWRSSNDNLVSVDDNGLAQGLAPGQVTITAATDGITSNPSRITVPAAQRTGTFTARPGSNYDCQGTATLQTRDGGGVELVFADDFLVSNGPRLEVFLSTSEVIGPGSINLAPLQNSIGTQTYALPEGVEINAFDWVIIHCVPFNVTFGFAQFR